ncbi:MAG TPA: hypothetical protein VK009_20640 [Chloroflexota bacterium]|nr:hypothetical protein [Chloroflexota bacterium]
MQDANPNRKPPPEDEALRRLYEEPHSARERHYGLMNRKEGEPDAGRD